MAKGRKQGETYSKIKYKNIDDIKSRFISKIEINCETECWEWKAGKFLDGYGAFGCYLNGEYKTRRAHRVSFEIFNSIITDGKQILHKCDNKICVNPNHLYEGSHSDNMVDLRNSGVLKGENNPNYGVKCSPEKKQKIRDGNIKAWKDPIVRERYLKSFRGTRHE